MFLILTHLVNCLYRLKLFNKKFKFFLQVPPPPAVVTVVLNVQMHCEACAQVLRKRIRKFKGRIIHLINKKEREMFDDSEKNM